ncbi:MAG: glycosyltransferase [Chloroflexota bacterium]|nr:glycosyltransferase [Chloroflexota bacterium]
MKRDPDMPGEEHRPFISVVIPCYNEEGNLERGVLDEVFQYLEQQDYPWEVIVVNDESTDNSQRLVEATIADKARFSLVNIPHGGKPAAVWAGIQQSRGDIVLFTDMDQSTPIGELDKLLPWYDQGYDVVIGSRGASREGFNLIRQVGSLVFRAMRSLFLLRDINDTQCGFKTSRREVALQTFPRLQFFKQEEQPSGWKVSAYDVELLYIVERAGYPIKEVIVEWQNRDESDTKGQQSDLARYVQESIEMGREVFRVKRNQVRGMYDDV